MVAWQFTARDARNRNRNRPVGNGMIGSEGTFSTLIGKPVSRPTQTVPYGTGPFCKRIPGSELPGYLHLVPPGQNPGTFLHF
jgi:hypothetical protein